MYIHVRMYTFGNKNREIKTNQHRIQNISNPNQRDKSGEQTGGAKSVSLEPETNVIFQIFFIGTMHLIRNPRSEKR